MVDIVTHSWFVIIHIYLASTVNLFVTTLL